MEDNNKQYLASMTIMGALFFIFGFVTWVNGPLITFVKLAFDLDTDSKAFLVTTVFYLAYFFLALPSSWILEKTGMKKGMAVGLITMAVGSFMFGHFTTARNYTMSLVGLFIIGSGISLLQTASNPYVSIIGPIATAAKRISIMGICNKVAGMLAPLIFGILVLKDVDQFETKVKAADPATKELLLNEFASSIYTPYLIMAILLLIFAVWITRSALPEIKTSDVNKAPAGAEGKNSIFQFAYLWLGALCIFVYVGAEVMAGDAIGTYGKGFNIPTDETKYFTTYTLIAMAVGYVLGLATIPKIISQAQALKISAILGILFTFAAVLTHGYVSVVFVACLGLANAMMWPSIWPLAIEGLGKFTEKGSALLIMGIAGGAIIPKVYASLKDDYDFQWTFFALTLPCYLYILFFAQKGHKIGR
ncbi:MAG TPA: sugar MFS transporter [Cyclobacteriaceae bacterium]|nr:sugar MFS transporter [Cyclobacteriaceae bacterium]